ncbi:MAG TPA: class I SAM-dependent methyltransferase [Propionibacteriaceae bacterium]
MDHQHQHADHHHHGHGNDAVLAELLDLDAEVLQSYLVEVSTWAHGLAPEATRVVDLGAGTGTGTMALAGLFTSAEIFAVDQSAAMLTRVRAKAEQYGFGDRVRTVEADVQSGWPELGPVDLIWASLSLHEMAEPERVFALLLDALAPGGLLVVIEMDAPPRFLPTDLGLGRPGFEERCHRVLEASRSGFEPHPDWGPRLVQAGLDLIQTRSFDVAPAGATPPSTGRYARGYLRQIGASLSERLAPDDVVVLETLIADSGPHSLLERDDLSVRGRRTAWVARRP